MSQKSFIFQANYHQIIEEWPSDHKTENGYEQNSAQFNVKPRLSWHCDKKLMPSSHPGVNADTRGAGNASG